MSLAEQWRAARPKVAGLHLDSGACSRQSFAVIDAAAQHARHEAEVGGYVAAEAAAPVLDAGRAAIGALTGMSGSDVVYTTGANDALDLLLSSWTGERTVACLLGEYGPNLAVMAANGFDVRALPVDGDGRLDVDATSPCVGHRPACAGAPDRAGEPPWHRPADGELADVCRGLGLPLVIDAAQALGHIDCAVAPTPSTRRRASGWRARAASASSRCDPSSRSACGRGCHRRSGNCR